MGWGCPIRRSGSQRVLASRPGFSQRATSFIASQCQGIHQMPLLRLILNFQTFCATRRDKPRHATANLLEDTIPAKSPWSLANRLPDPTKPTTLLQVLGSHISTISNSHRSSRSNLRLRVTPKSNGCPVPDRQTPELLMPVSWWR
jgi:hypothetical protein